MKHRWIGGLLLGVVLTLAACAPPGSGGGSSDGAAAESSAPDTSAEPMESHAPDDSGGRYDY
jgi:hypothetical protein